MRNLAIAAIALVAGFVGAAAFSFSGLGDERTRDYLLANPEVLPEAIEVLQRREMANLIEPIRSELEEPFPGAVLGNPNGTVTLVEFVDYACGYCRYSVQHVNELIAANPDLRVVIREYPILSAGSADAARMALAAAQQGKYEAFHTAMFTHDEPSRENIEAAAREAGVDLARAEAAIEAGTFENHLQNNIFLGQNMQLTGTPAWVVGEKIFNGAVGVETISDAIAEAREL